MWSSNNSTFKQQQQPSTSYSLEQLKAELESNLKEMNIRERDILGMLANNRDMIKKIDRSNNNLVYEDLESNITRLERLLEI
jgi:hypothetical protein